MEEKRVLLMLSGGRDSFLSACRLLEDKKNTVIMVTFDNGCMLQSENAGLSAERIIQKYGKERASYLGVYKIYAVIRDFFWPYMNMKPVDQKHAFYGLTPSQFQCLICRTSMYIYSIWIAKRERASYIAEGAREDQKFVIELPGMAKKRYRELVENVGIELLLPVYDLKSDWERDNELMRYGYICKTMEPKCLVGVPIENSIDESVIKGVHQYYDQIILPKIIEQGYLTDNRFVNSLSNERIEVL